jgi:osmotically-inducible protein OsmY
MKFTLIFSVVVMAVPLIGCNEENRAIERGNSGEAATSSADNTGINVRDRSDTAKTPIDQNENQADVNITAEIRKRVVNTQMSLNAQNVKIITQDGKVTLRGPVKSADEKAQIEKLAQDVAGAANVDSQLEVQP